jgi:hypothetical protein
MKFEQVNEDLFLNTYEDKTILKKFIDEWAEDELIQNNNEVKRPSSVNMRYISSVGLLYFVRCNNCQLQ